MNVLIDSLFGGVVPWMAIDASRVAQYLMHWHIEPNTFHSCSGFGTIAGLA